MPAITYNRNDLKAVYLPVGNMLQIDRVYSITNRGLIAEVDLADHWVFPLHFPNDPIFPGCLLIEAAGQAIAIWAWHFQLKGDPRLAKVKADFRIPVTPTNYDVIKFETHVIKRGHVCFGTVNILVKEQLAALIELVLTIVPTKVLT